MHYFIRNICIGLIDGITIPFALAAALSQPVERPYTVIAACTAAAVAGAITMSIGSYREGRKYENSQRPLAASITVGISYLLGGLLVCIPYFLVDNNLQALKYTATLSLVALAVSGYVETSIHGKTGWAGALRVAGIGALAATATFLASKLFV